MSKKDHAQAANLEQLEDDPSMLDEPEGRTFSREMKIGVGAILLLVAVLGVVLANRLRGSSAGDKSAAQSASAAKPEAGADKKATSGTSTSAQGKQTVLTATGDANTPPAPSPASSLWSTPTDLTPPSNASASSPPSFMPPKNSSYSGYSAGSSSSSSPSSSTGSAQDNAGFTMVGDPQPTRDFRSKSSRSKDSSTTSLGAVNQLPDSLTPPAPATSTPGSASADPHASSPGLTDTSSTLPATPTGPYGGDFSGSRSHSRRDRTSSSGAMSGSSGLGSAPPANSGYSVASPASSPYGNSSTTPSYAPPAYGSASSEGASYGRSSTAGRGAGNDLQSPQFGGSGTIAPAYSGGSTPGYSSSPQAPSLASPPAVSTSPDPATSRLSSRGGPSDYVIQPNDNYSTISKKRYGTDAYFQALAEHNLRKFPEPDKLKVGETISAPSAEELMAKYPSLCPKPEHVAAAADRSRFAGTSGRIGGGRTYVVREGDSLFDIAKYELGKASRWVEIYELNRDALGTSFNYLTPGMQLNMPEKGAASSMTQRSDTTSLR